MNKPYYERPDWILKSIGYFCDNYTIDGKDLGKMKLGAIETYKRGDRLSSGDNLNGRLGWEQTQQRYNFWASLWYLHTRDDRCEDPAKCAPWTDYEKRKIAKLPRVK
jgi:hypothetical protein